MAFTINEIDCGIVTFNPDIERLSENIHAVIDQVALVHIFDNGSNNFNDIVSLVNTISVTKINLIRGGENFGMAVALNRLCRAALERGQKAIFLLDQDSITGVDCLRGLSSVMECEKESTGLVTAFSIDRNKRAKDNRPKSDGVQEISRTSTSGSLINLNAYCAIGGYDELLFVDWVDYDFCYRLIKKGFKVRINNSVSILHELGHSEFACCLPMRDQTGKWHLTPQYRTNHSYQRRFDQARSVAIVCKKNRGTTLARQERSLFLKETVTLLIIEKKKLALLKARVLGWMAGSRAYAVSKSENKTNPENRKRIRL